jgi:hypothetical protein
MYALNIGAPRYRNQILDDLKGEIGCNIIVVGNFNTPLSIVDKIIQTEN